MNWSNYTCHPPHPEPVKSAREASDNESIVEWFEPRARAWLQWNGLLPEELNDDPAEHELITDLAGLLATAYAEGSDDGRLEEAKRATEAKASVQKIFGTCFCCRGSGFAF